MEGVGVITLDNPPVNALSFAYCAKLLAAIEAAERDPEIKAVVITGANGLFSAGADVNDFQHEPPPNRHDDSRRDRRDRGKQQNVRRGDRRQLPRRRLELALACDYRVRIAALEARTAGDQARAPAGRRRNAAAAAADRRAGRAGVHAQGLAGHGRSARLELGILDEVVDGRRR